MTFENDLIEKPQKEVSSIKKQPRYFSHISHTLTTKNQLEKAINEFLNANNQRVIDDIEDFKKHVLEGINALNEANKRCAPKKVSWWENGNEGTIMLSGYNVCNFYLYKEMEVENG